MKKLFLLFLFAGLSFIVLVDSCKPDASCTDGKQNQGETGIDCVTDTLDACTCGCPLCENATSCNNGVQDGGELGVDCGGPCPNNCQTTPTCTDGIQNGTETGVDCGGSCSPCNTNPTGTFTCMIDGSAFSSTSITATAVSPILTITATNGTKSVTLTYSGTFTVGNHTLGAGTTITYTDGAEQCISLSDGTLNFSQFDTTNKKVSGTFTANCVVTGTNGHALTSGVFTNVSYN